VRDEHAHGVDAVLDPVERHERDVLEAGARQYLDPALAGAGPPRDGRATFGASERCHGRELLERMEVAMTYESRLLAGILLIVLPTVMIGGVSILSLLIADPAYMENPLRQDLWRAGHAHAGVWLVLALVMLRYVDEANLSNLMKWLVRAAVPIAAILVPAAFFLSVLSPTARAPNGLIYLAYVGAVLLAIGVLVLGVGLVKRPAPRL
jgi:hypothetical protein